MKTHFEYSIPFCFMHNTRTLLQFLNQLTHEIDPSITFALQESDYDNDVLIRISKELPDPEKETP